MTEELVQVRKSTALPLMAAAGVVCIVVAVVTLSTRHSGAQHSGSAMPIAVTAATSPPSSDSPSTSPVPTVVRFPDEGLSMVSAPTNAITAVGASDTIASFGSLAPIRSHYSSAVSTPSIPPTIVLVDVTDSLPLDESTEGASNPPSQYRAWLVTYAGTTPDFRGPPGASLPPANSLTCDLVGIRNASTGEWTKIFQSCSPTKS
jgi:hypothetical protein